MSPLTTHPWTCSGNECVPDLYDPNLCSKILTSSPPSLTLAGSFPAGQKNAGVLILETNAVSLSPKAPQRPKDGWNPTKPLNPSNLAENLNPAQTPQQNPTP